MRAPSMLIAGSSLLALANVAHADPCSGFTDVDSSASYCAAVDFIKNKGITTGCSGSAYCPSDPVTRSQMALFLYRMAKGGPENTLGDFTSTISGGAFNRSGSDFDGHPAAGAYAVVGGGNANEARGSRSTVAGGQNNRTFADFATIAGGTDNRVANHYGVVGGGYNNTVGGYGAVIPGGTSNSAYGFDSWVGGTRGYAESPGEFVWSDSIGADFDPSLATHGWSGHAANTFNVRSTGGIWIVTGVDIDGAPTTGAYINPGSGTWAATSDRASKENFADVDDRDVLERVAAMPVASWNYIAEGAHIRHLGPVAQDFHAAFGLGRDDVSITSIDEGGVALAAIKGLHAQHREAMARKDAEIGALRERLDALERRLVQLADAVR